MLLTSISNEQTHENKGLSLSCMESVKFSTHMSTLRGTGKGLHNTMGGCQCHHQQSGNYRTLISVVL